MQYKCPLCGKKCPDRDGPLWHLYGVPQSGGRVYQQHHLHGLNGVTHET